MLKLDAQLNPHVFDADVEQVPIRFGFGEGLLEAGKRDERVVALCADLTESTRMHLFRDAFSQRFIEVGITEQHMASVASGMAAMGKVPFISSYAMFSPGRNWEQIRTTICYNNVPVKIAGSHAGLSVGPDGGTHQAIEDIALTRIIPRMEVVVPCDALEAKRATLALAQSNKPAYIRLAREKTPLVTTEETPFEIGKAYEVYRTKFTDDSLQLTERVRQTDTVNCELQTVNSPRVAIIAIGPMVHKAMLAAKQLEAEGIGSIVVNSHTVKPLDRETILRVARETRAVVTAEEHQVAGGLGSAVAELLAEELPTNMAFVGVADRFGQSGTPDELAHEYGLDVATIVRKTKHLL